MENFGFSINQTRAVNLNKTDFTKFNMLVEKVPSYKRCFSCGGCAAACSARLFIDFNIRKVHCTFRRGQYETLAGELQKCMLCGKCMLVCPRGVNLRSLIINMRQILFNTEENL